MKYLSAWVFLLLAHLLIAQKGDFYMNHYSPRDLSADYMINDIETDKDGLLWLATNYGLIRYDGISWDFFNTPSAALSLVIDEDNQVFAGCVGEVGRMDYSNNNFRYRGLFRSDTASDIYYKGKVVKGTKFFVGNTSLVGIKGDSIKLHYDSFRNIETQDSVLKAYTSDEVYSFTTITSFKKEKLSRDPVAFSMKSPKGHIKVLEDGTLFLNNDSLIHNKIISERGILPIEGQFINDSLFVLTTLDEGAVFLDLNDTSYVQKVDYYTGLPDNEIFSVHVDQEKGVWMAHEYGLTRILPLFPTRSFSTIPGLTGNLTQVLQYNEKLWLATSLGVYYLDKDTTFRQKVYYDVIPIRKKTPKPQEKVKEEKKEDTGFLGGIFGNKKKKKKKKKNNFFKELGSKLEDVFYHENLTDRIKGKKDKNVRYVRREEKIPINVNIQYKQVPGTDGKFQQFMVLNNNLLASGTSGVFEINEKESFLVIDEPFKNVITTKGNRLLGYTYTGELALFEKDEDVWIELWKIPLTDEILSIYEDKNNHIWLAGPKNLYRTSISDSTMVLEDQLQISNQFFDEIDMIEIDGVLSFLNTQGFYSVDRDNSIEINEQINLAIGDTEKHLKDNAGNIWSFSGKKWYRISPDGKVKAYEYLSLFPQIENLYLQKETGDYWLITEDNQLLSYNLSDEINLGGQYDLIVKRINSQSRVFKRDKEFTLDFSDNSLIVELSKPDYTGLLKTQYQYKLQGLNNDWSEWTSSTVIDFSYLPPGKYALKVRSKDSFDRVKEAELLNFKVQEPYWQTPWFYSLQVILFFSLVIVSSRLNQSNSANRFLSGALTIFTIVLLIEFLQSVISSYFSFKSGPVIEFLIDAVIAVCIFPLEAFLRKMITQGIPNKTLQTISRNVIFGVQKVVFGISKRK